jgi:hypothetical protein
VNYLLIRTLTETGLARPKPLPDVSTIVIVLAFFGPFNTVSVRLPEVAFAGITKWWLLSEYCVPSRALPVTEMFTVVDDTGFGTERVAVN